MAMSTPDCSHAARVTAVEEEGIRASPEVERDTHCSHAVDNMVYHIRDLQNSCFADSVVR